MTYYKVQEYKEIYVSDTRLGHSIVHVFVKDELYTEIELNHLLIDVNNLPNFIKRVDVERSNIYWFFGTRFEV